jgi:cell division septation protein DedD
MNDPEIIGPGDRFDDPFADEAFDEPRAGMSGRAKLFAGAAVAVGLIALVAVGWFAFQQGIRSGAEEAAPVVRADPDPFKRKPLDPGGLEVPHQDKLVFNRLAPGQVQEPVERLLPPPEEPVERPESPPEAAPASPAPETAATELPERVVEALPSPQSAPVPGVNAPAPPAPPVEASPETAPTTQATTTAPPPPPPPATPFVREAEPQIASKPVAPPAPPTKPAAQAGKGWKIQLASVSSEASAQADWTRIKAKHTDLLGALALNVQTVKLERGTFYRIQAGPLSDEDAARALCGQLKSQNQDCLIVAP